MVLSVEPQSLQKTTGETDARLACPKKRLLSIKFIKTVLYQKEFSQKLEHFFLVQSTPPIILCVFFVRFSIRLPLVSGCVYVITPFPPRPPFHYLTALVGKHNNKNHKHNSKARPE